MGPEPTPLAKNIIEVDRIKHTEDVMISRVKIPGLPGPFFFAEDNPRSGPKVKHDTPIPEGTYDLILRNAGSMITRWREKTWVKGWGGLKAWIMLKDVPGFSYIYLHAGNDEDDTSGCLLTGKTTITKNGEVDGVGRSVEAMIDIYDYLLPKLENGEKWKIQIRNSY
jgi:hypothetical protein